ncbi:hypothetical protein MXD62_13085 [Frankia sp. Mgl5]|uniref:hypothetical protein n=1 Tax=Frankia sp. Mgl5 TaxID=2933793 RepID=UPI00200D2B6D|nr:hypothetical protein [Frankia sp. Mgl5]MCK9928095.1 hypothetical protein [Frankia sp. Mgl5]
MSPIGGVGINLAIQDAVAAARILRAPLLAGRGTGTAPPPGCLAAVQRRRTPPTILTQLAQRVAQRGLLRPVLEAGDKPVTAPMPVRLLARIPAAQRVLARAVGVGLRPEAVGQAAPHTATENVSRAATNKNDR